jgi:hypothetical protein
MATKTIKKPNRDQLNVSGFPYTTRKALAQRAEDNDRTLSGEVRAIVNRALKIKTK